MVAQRVGGTEASSKTVEELRVTRGLSLKQVAEKLDEKAPGAIEAAVTARASSQ